MEPVDLSIKIKVETVPSHVEEFRRSGLVLAAPTATIGHEIDSTIQRPNKVPRLSYPFSSSQIQLETNNNVHINHSDLLLNHKLTNINIPTTSTALSQHLHFSNNSYAAVMPLSSQYNIDKFLNYGGLQIFPSTSFSTNSPPDSPKATAVGVKNESSKPVAISEPICTSLSVPSSSSNKRTFHEANESSSKPEILTTDNSQLKESPETISKTADPAPLKTESPPISTSSSSSNHEITQHENSDTITSSKNTLTDVPRILPPSLTDSLVFTHFSSKGVPLSLSLPPPHLSHETLAAFIKDNPNHFPLHMAHFSTGLSLPRVSVDASVKQGL